MRRKPEDAAQTREAIVDAALGVFARRGYSASLLEEIAGAAGVTRGALYHHFAGKDELFLAVLRERWSSATEPLLEHLAGRDPGDVALRRFVTAFLRATDTDPATRALLRISLSGDFPPDATGAGLATKLDVWADWRRRFERTLKRAGIRSALALRAETLLSNLLGYALRSALEGPPTTPSYDRRAELILRGILQG